MKDIINQLYNGLLRFIPVNKYIKVKSSHKELFPLVGFLDNEKTLELENSIGCEIHNVEYFEQALIHRSYLQVIEESEYLSNERLEFLGDAVLGMIAADYLFMLHTHVLEGDLTKMRSWLVNKNSLALAAKKLNLEEFVMLSYSAEKSMKSGSDSILADTLEAIVAAIYLDSGLDTARKFVVNTLIPILMNKNVMTDTNYKSLLLENIQGMGKNSPVYHVLDERGPDHDKTFTIGVYVENELAGTGSGKSKKQAEQSAAQTALQQLEDERTE